MDAEGQLFLLCEDVLEEIFKYLTFEDMKNLSLTSKCGFEVTKEYFGKRSKGINKRKELHTLQERQTPSSSVNIPK